MYMYVLCMYTPSYHTHSITNYLTHIFTLTHCAPPPFFSPSFTHPLPPSFTHPLPPSVTHPLIPSLSLSLSLSFSLPQSTDTQSTALHEAATAGSLECVQYLLGQGADRSALNCNGDSPFDCSTQLEIRQCVGCLHVYTSCIHLHDVHVYIHVVGVCLPLHRLLAVGVNRLLVAACTGDSNTLRTLINEEGLSPSHEFQQGVTALHEACEGGHEECVAVLINLGADINKQVHVYACLYTKCT